MEKWKGCFTSLKIFSVIVGIQTLSCYFISFGIFAYATSSAMIACLMGLYYMTYLVIPILFSSFMLTMFYKYAIMLRKEIEK